MDERRLAPMRRLPLIALLALAGTASIALGAAGVDKTRLPLGDGKYVTQPKKGYVDSCITQFHGGGAFRDGPWIDAGARTWDLTKKIAVQGSVRWKASFSAKVVGSKRVLQGNGLPATPTGVFPVAASDPAYQYDRNPNSIRSYTLVAKLPATPALAKSPTCAGGTIGVMRDGIPIYSSFDAGGRDAPAHEIQDACGGHPQITGQYHYHSLPPCLTDAGSKHSQLLGWALDGFGIYGPRGEDGKTLGSAGLDACHGHTHTIVWNGKRVRMYHYHATYDFPYVVGCFRGAPITTATGLMIGTPR
jgi:hypothetical protein